MWRRWFFDDPPTTDWKLAVTCLIVEQAYLYLKEKNQTDIAQYLYKQKLEKNILLFILFVLSIVFLLNIKFNFRFQADLNKFISDCNNNPVKRKYNSFV